MWKNFVERGRSQVTDDSMAHVHCMMDDYGYRHRLCNTYCFHTATMVARTHLIVTFIRTVPVLFCITFHLVLGTAVAQWLRCCATNRKIAGSIPDGVIGIFH